MEHLAKRMFKLCPVCSDVGRKPVHKHVLEVEQSCLKHKCRRRASFNHSVKACSKFTRSRSLGGCFQCKFKYHNNQKVHMDGTYRKSDFPLQVCLMAALVAWETPNTHSKIGCLFEGSACIKSTEDFVSWLNGRTAG